MITPILIFLTTFAISGGSTSNTTLQLPITINPLLQDAIQRGPLAESLIKTKISFFEHVTFNDIVKNLGLHNRVPQLKKLVKALVVLGLSAEANRLTVDKFEFVNASKWTITMSVEELAKVSNNITLPIRDEISLIIIQEAMFKVLENRFTFKTEEIAKRLNTTTDEVYALLEPGWIKVVNFITEKNILALSTNYTIPPFYIAEALDMTLSELYNSTLPQLEDILLNKIDAIKEAAERWKRILSSSIAGLLRVSSTEFSTVVPTMSQINSTVPIIIERTTTMAIQSSFNTQTKAKTSSILTEISSSQAIPRPEMSRTSTETFTATPESRSTIALQSGSIPNTTSMNSPTMGIQSTTFSFTIVESSSVPAMQKSTAAQTQSITAMYHTPDSMTTTQVPQREQSSILQSANNQASTQQHSTMFQSTISKDILPTNTEMSLVITSKPSATSSDIAETYTSISPPDLSQRTSSKITATSSDMMKISSTSYMTTSETLTTQIMDTSSSKKITTTKILPTSTIVPKSSYVSTSNDLTKSMVNTAPTPSLGKAISSYGTTAYDRSKTTTLDAMKSSSMAGMTSIVTTSVIITTSSYGKIRTETSKLSTSSHSELSTETANVLTSSQSIKTTQSFFESTGNSRTFPTNPKLPSSSHPLITTSITTSKISTSSKYQQSTEFLKRSSGITSTADGVISKTIILVKPTSYHTTSSSHVQDITKPPITYSQSISITVTTSPTTPNVDTTSNAARSEDDIDPVVIIVIPIMCVLFLAVIAVAFVMWIKNRRRRKSAQQHNKANGSELSRKGLVESLENINNNRTTGFVNRGGDSRSMSRTSSMSNLETIHEGHEPEEPEIYDL